MPLQTIEVIQDVRMISTISVEAETFEEAKLLVQDEIQSGKHFPRFLACSQEPQYNEHGDALYASPAIVKQPEQEDRLKIFL